MIEPNNFDIAYSSLTDCYYVVIGKEKYDITNFVKGKIQQGRADAIKDFLKETGKYIYYMDKYTDVEGQMISIENLNLIAEQIKEQKNE